MVQYLHDLDSAFAALSDPTRRGILQMLGAGDASISVLAQAFGMTLTGIKKHVQVLEDAELVTTRKAGRVRVCRLGPQRLEEEAAWIAGYRALVEQRYDALSAFLESEEPEPEGIDEP
jgi:DNA-binding transcriptional ArsR family regulator